MPLTKNMDDFIKIAQSTEMEFIQKVFIPALRKSASRNGMASSDSALAAIIKMGFILENAGVEAEEIKSADTATINSINRLVEQASADPILRAWTESQEKAANNLTDQEVLYLAGQV